MTSSQQADIQEWRDLGAAEDEADGTQIDEYDLSSVPNDFNILTIFNFIESGAVRIPGFQRNYVWDLKRASKLIESLILGLPVPQVFLYEAGRNEYLVIDGQQRLLTIYFFMKQRFPKRSKRGELRTLLEGKGTVSEELLHDDRYFENFRLRLPDHAEGEKNKFGRLSYATLGDYKTQFDLRTIRNIIVKQIRPSDDDSSIYEMFHRLNSGGMNLTPQEIRASLYYSPFFDMLSIVNMMPSWRKLVGMPDPDLHLRDTEILLRAVAMYCNGDQYGSSMAQFFNRFSKQAMGFTESRVSDLQSTLEWFIDAVSSFDAEPGLFSSKNGRFSVTTFEAAFRAAGRLRSMRPTYEPDLSALLALREDESFLEFSKAGSSHKSNVAGRLARAFEILDQ